MRKLFTHLFAAAAIATLAACGSTGGGLMGGDSAPPPIEIRSGVVEQITETQVKSTHDQGLGAIVGGIAGAGLGSLIGGNMAQNRYFDKPQAAQQVIVRLNSGVLVAITQPPNPALARGMRVYVEGQGHEARVVAR